MLLMKSKYYDEFLRYFSYAKWQHENCNLGITPHMDSPFDDDLMKHVQLYDVVKRKYAGFGQILCDMWYDKENHPYKSKLTPWREEVIDSFINRDFWGYREWLYVFFVHRLTGSGINYAKNPSGYHNSILLEFGPAFDVDDMQEIIGQAAASKTPMFTSAGYQIAPFPEGGVNFMRTWLPAIIDVFMYHLDGRQMTFREAMNVLNIYHKNRGWRMFWFQYAAALADIADYFPNRIKAESPFFYGSNAKQCLSYLTDCQSKSDKALDEVTSWLCSDTGSLPYDVEDVACDFIRWQENYINIADAYKDLDLDKIFSSAEIVEHPYGRQKIMLDLGLVKSFNGMKHPTGPKIIKAANLTELEYVDMVLARVRP